MSGKFSLVPLSLVAAAATVCRVSYSRASLRLLHTLIHCFTLATKLFFMALLTGFNFRINCSLTTEKGRQQRVTGRGGVGREAGENDRRGSHLQC